MSCDGVVFGLGDPQTVCRFDFHLSSHVLAAVGLVGWQPGRRVGIRLLLVRGARRQRAGFEGRWPDWFASVYRAVVRPFCQASESATT